MYFNEILFLFMKRSYQKHYKTSLTAIGSDIMNAIEEINLKKLQIINRKLYKLGYKKQVKKLVR